jgi:hypothetical protein
LIEHDAPVSRGYAQLERVRVARVVDGLALAVDQDSGASAGYPRYERSQDPGEGALSLIAVTAAAEAEGSPPSDSAATSAASIPPVSRRPSSRTR